VNIVIIKTNSGGNRDSGRVHSHRHRRGQNHSIMILNSHLKWRKSL